MSIEKLKNAIERLDSYGAPRDDSRVFVDEDNCSYELLDGEDGPNLTLADLRAICL